MRTAACVAFGVRTGRLHVAFAAWRLPLSFAARVTRRVATAGAGSLTLPRTIALAVACGARALTLAATSAIALASALTLAVSGETGGFALRHDHSWIDLHVASAVTLRFRRGVCLALRRDGSNLKLYALSKDAVHLQRQRAASGLCCGTRIVRTRCHLRVRESEITTHVSASLRGLGFHLQAAIVQVSCSHQERPDLRVGARVCGNPSVDEIRLPAEIRTCCVREPAQTPLATIDERGSNDEEEQEQDPTRRVSHASDLSPGGASSLIRARTNPCPWCSGRFVTGQSGSAHTRMTRGEVEHEHRRC